jgi:hypothetical protein
MPVITSNNTGDPPVITIINVQSYPVVGGKWVVMFNTIGRANLTITAVNGTTWGNVDDDHDLKFLEVKCGNKTLDSEWVNNSVFIANYSSNKTGYETSEVLTPGRHTLMFRFGDDVAFANNLASEYWLQTTTSDFNNGTKNNINVSDGAFHLNETYYIRNTTLINNESFEGDWPPTDWTATGEWNKESDQAHGGTYSADLDGTPFGGQSGDLITPAMDCSDSNVTAIYIDFWSLSDRADNDDYYLDYYNGSSWNQITRLDNLGGGSWYHYTDAITDPQYFVSNFKIRWRVVTLGWTEHVYADDVTITLEKNESGYGTNGSLISETHDTGREDPTYTNIIVDNSTSGGTSITTWVRAADTQVNLSTATWYTDIDQVPHERWIQWRINLTGDEDNTPTIYEVNLTWGYDNDSPISTVNSISPYWQSTTSFEITATASDNDTDVEEVALYYNYSENNASVWSGWTLYGENDTTVPYSWSFNTSNASNDGYYRFYSIAIDSSDNVEDPPSGYDTFCGVDTVDPSSEVDDISPYWYNDSTKPVIINVTNPTDNLSGIKSITLYYRYRVDNVSLWESWGSYDTDSSSPWQWSFNFPKGKGHYQFYSTAYDNASNYEGPPVSPDNDTECGYNTTAPSSEVDSIIPYWHNTSPLTITGQATDFSGSGLKNVTLYYYNSSGNSSWHGPWMFGVDTDPWDSISWNFNFPEGEGYYRFYSIAANNNSNSEDCTGNDTECGYDISKPLSQVDVVSPYWKDESDNPMIVTVTDPTDNLSGVKNITLYYRYRVFNESMWGSWNFYSKDEKPSWLWAFTFPDGEGHYQFYSRANDTVGNWEDSPVSPDYDTACGYDIQHEFSMDYWLQTTSSDFNNGTKNNINVSDGAFHLNETYYIRNYTLINQESFEGMWPPSDWTATGRWNKESDQAHTGTYSADFDGGGFFGRNGDMDTSALDCSDNTVTAIYVDFWNYDGGADNGEYYLYYYDGINWDQITRLDNFGEGSWAHYTDTITDPQYFVSNFRIRWGVVRLDNNEHVYVDDVTVTVEKNESGYVTDGNLLSETHDTGRVAPIYTNIIVDHFAPSGTSITTWVRAADTQVNLSTATWYTDIDQVPHERWVQWRINLTGDEDHTPTVYEVNLTWNYDNDKPISGVDAISPYWQNSDPFEITATASDDGTGIKEVALYYNYSANNASGWSGWTLYGSNDTSSPYNWSFSPSADGYYRFYSIATDSSDNVEDPPTSPDYDTFCGVDTVDPSSEVDDISPYWYNKSTKPVFIAVSTATDSLSGLKNISLYYRYRTDNDSSWGTWRSYGTDNSLPWSWSFNFPKGRGHYQFYSIAYDNASNDEDPPVSPDNDTECGYNDTAPSSEVDAISPYWHNSSPLTITGQATDFNGSGLKNVTLYYYNSSDNSNWYGPSVFGVDTDPWVSISWNFTFPTGEGYYRFYSIAIDNDSNCEDFTGNDTECAYDTSKPLSQVDAITPYWYNASDNPLVIAVTNPSDDLSGVKNITLYYRHRGNNGSSWGSWASFGVDENSPWSWDFNFPSGDGHYQIYSRANDTAGNREDSPTSPGYDTDCGYDSGKPTSNVNTITPYNQSAPSLVITATASNGASGVKNVTLWYRFSEDNSTWEPGQARIKVQKVVGSLDGSGSKTESIMPVSSLDRAFLIYEFTGHDSADDTPGEAMSCAYLSDTGNITIEKSNNAGGSDYSVYVIECLNEEFIVRKRGTITLGTTETSDTDSVSNIKDVSKVFVTSSQRSDGGGTGDWYRSYCTVELTSSTTVTAERSASGITAVVRYEAIEWLIDGVTVQTKEKTLTNLDTDEQTDTLNTSVDLSRSFVYSTFRHNSNGLAQTSVRCRLSSTNTVAFRRGGGTYTSIARWWVVQFPQDSVTVNRGTGTKAAPNDVIDVTVPSCNLSRSFAISSGSNSGTNTAFPRGRYYANLSSTTNLRLVTGYSGNTQYYAWQVIDTTDWTANGYNWSEWDNAGNPDTSSPWQWTFDFPNGTGYYQFYSIAKDYVGIVEDSPSEKDAACYYVPYVSAAPVINSYNLSNSTGSKLNNYSGLLDVNNEYCFTINITDPNGWIDIDYIEIKAWYDDGSESTTYNQTQGGNLNMYLQYENTTGTANFSLLWPDDEVQLISGNCTETIIDETTRIINISFKPRNQVRWASSNDTWNGAQNTTNDHYSWNFNITVIDASGLKAWKKDEYGVYKFTSILPNQDWVNVIAPPGFWDDSSIVTITYSSNYDFNMTIYFEENLTNTTWGDTIPIANNVYILGGADPNDDVTYDVMFAGIGEANAIDIFNDSGIFHSNNISQTVNVQFNVYIPLGTHGGKYTARVATKIMQD